MERLAQEAWVRAVGEYGEEAAQAASRVAPMLSFTPPPKLFAEALSLPSARVRGLLRLFLLPGKGRVPQDHALASALLAYWAGRTLEEAGVAEGGLMTAVTLVALRSRGGGWREGLAAWAKALRSAHGEGDLVDLNAPLRIPLWVEEPARPLEALKLLTTWAKAPVLWPGDRNLLYLLKDSLMALLWNRGFLRFVGIVARPRPLPPHEGLVEAHLAWFRSLEEAFWQGGYEALAPFLRRAAPEQLPLQGEELLPWAERAAWYWAEQYQGASDLLPRSCLILPPELLVPLMNEGKAPPQGASWEEILESSPHLVDPMARYLVLAKVEDGQDSMLVHMPYRTARRMRLLTEELRITEERPYDQRIGWREVGMESYGKLQDAVSQMGYPPARFPKGLAPRREAEAQADFLLEAQCLG